MVTPQVATTPLMAALSIFVPEVRDQTEAELRALVARQGKFTKLESFYFGVTPILPVAWFYGCSECAVYDPGARTCAFVEGRIEPYAWCPLFVPRKDDPPFSWLGRSLGVTS